LRATIINNPSLSNLGRPQLSLDLHKGRAGSRGARGPRRLPHVV
jgi:hypothetical protein